MCINDEKPDRNRVELTQEQQDKCRENFRKQKGNKVPFTTDDLLKYEIAAELGVLDKALTEGWRSLSAKETGRIGGILGRRRKELRAMVEKR
ncbi:MAG: small, acid-soluble spore protein, alpha/beta type [Eubacterium sp.]